MGARKITVVDPDAIIEDMPVKTPVGRNRRKAEYQAERAAEQTRKRVAPRAPRPITEEHPYPGYISPEEFFPAFDFVAHPEGPDISDPLVFAYCEIQWKSFKKYARKLRAQEQA